MRFMYHFETHYRHNLQMKLYQEQIDKMNYYECQKFSVSFSEMNYCTVQERNCEGVGREEEN